MMKTPYGNHLLPLCLMAGILFFSCAHNDKGSEKEGDTTAVSGSSERPEIQQWLTGPLLGEWFRRAQQKDSSLTETGFLPGGADHLQISPEKQKIGDDEWNVYQAYFFYSPDKTKAIDLYSYGTMPVKQKDGSVRLESGEADNEVSLVHVGDRTKQRMLFSGPGTTYQKVAWVGDSVALITGISDANEANKMLPVIWEVNFSDSTVKIFNYKTGSDSTDMP